MKTKTFLFPIVALLAVFLVGAVFAADVVDGEAVVQLDGISINHVHNGTLELATFSGETIPIKVLFTASTEAEDVRVKVEISSGNEEYSNSYFIGNVINDSKVYRTGVMSLKIPSRLEDLSEDTWVRVSITADGLETYFREYKVGIQRNSYELRILSLDYDLDASAGSTIPVMVVIKNTGFQNNDDVYLTVAVPELGISSRAYLEDLVAVEDCSDGCDRRDSVSKILNLRIPSDAEEGIYDLTVTVYNADTRTVEKGVLKVSAPSASSNLVATSKEQDLKAGETKDYDLVIVNSEDSIKVYTISVVSSSSLEVSVPSVVTVAPQSAYTVPITVKAKNDAETGSYTFNVVVDGKQTSFVANVVKSNVSSIGIVVLTIFLAIVFVALLVLLIVLLFKREKKVEEVETSYY
jgi:uncharacterized membrane protein